MITVTCAKTGIEFEADSKRQKNHPLISQILNEAAKDKYNTGTYRIALAACEEVKRNGVDNIDEAIEFIRSRMDGNTETKLDRRAVEQRERKEARRARDERNAILRQHGYRWHKEDEESMDAFGATAFETTYGIGSTDGAWTLIAPDGRPVTVDEALAEIGEK